MALVVTPGSTPQQPLSCRLNRNCNNTSHVSMMLFREWVIGWLVGWLVGLFIGWLVGWFVHWLVVWLIV